MAPDALPAAPQPFRRTPPQHLTHHPIPIPAVRAAHEPLPLRAHPDAPSLTRPIAVRSHARPRAASFNAVCATPGCICCASNACARMVSFGSAVTPDDGTGSRSTADADGEDRTSWDWPWDEEERRLRMPHWHSRSTSSSSTDGWPNREREPRLMPARYNRNAFQTQRSHSALAGDSCTPRADGPRPWDMTDGGKDKNFASFGFRKGDLFHSFGDTFSSRNLGRHGHGKARTKNVQAEWGTLAETPPVNVVTKKRFRLFRRKRTVSSLFFRS